MSIKIDKAKLVQAIDVDVEKALDIHSTFQWEHFLYAGIDAHFIGREVLLDGTEQLVDASKYWKQVEYKWSFEGMLTLPRNRRAVSAYSRRAFDYPQLCVWAKLPNLLRVGNESIVDYYLGIEHGAMFFNGILSFTLRTDATATNRLMCLVGSLDAFTHVNIDVNKPSDFSTAYHVYRILHSKNLTVFTIDNKPVLFVIPSEFGGAVKVKENVLPYSVVLTGVLPRTLTTLLEINAIERSAEATSDIVAPISPYRFRVSNGHEILSLRLPLYKEDTNTLFTGKIVNSGILVSHPFPVFGYAGKTIIFRANVTGDLVIETYTKAGNWRTYDALSYSANNNFIYNMAGNIVLARLKYTPASYPATVAEGEIILI